MSYSEAKGKAETLRLALKNATSVINQRDATLKLIRGDLGPLMTLEWGAAVLRICGAKRVNDFLQLLRSSIIHPKDYAALANLAKGEMKRVICLTPPHWDTWAICIRKSRGRPHFKWGDLIETANVLRTHDIGTPRDLARAPKPRIESLALTNERKTNRHILRQAKRCFLDDNPHPGADVEKLSDDDARGALDMIRAELIGNTHCEANDRRLMESLDMPPNFEKLTHSAKTNSIALSGAPSHSLTEFMDNRAKLNVLRSVKGSIRSVADGISTCLRFCKMTNNRPSPPAKEIIRKWIATFNPGKIFGLYINQSRRAAILLNCDDGWITSEIRLIASGLCDEQDRGFAFPNSTRSADLFKIIDREGMRPTIGMVSYFPYLFPSEFRLGLCISGPLFHLRN